LTRFKFVYGEAVTARLWKGKDNAGHTNDWLLSVFRSLYKWKSYIVLLSISAHESLFVHPVRAKV